MKKSKEIKVEVKYTPGYEKRFTKACLEVLERRKEKPWNKRDIVNNIDIA